MRIFRDKVCYIGHMLNIKGVSRDPRKLEAVREFPKPKNVKNIRQFLGLAGFYRRFIKNFAQIAKPLSKLLHNDIVFKWTEKEEQVFFTLKEHLCKPQFCSTLIFQNLLISQLTHLDMLLVEFFLREK